MIEDMNQEETWEGAVGQVQIWDTPARIFVVFVYGEGDEAEEYPFPLNEEEAEGVALALMQVVSERRGRGVITA